MPPPSLASFAESLAQCQLLDAEQRDEVQRLQAEIGSARDLAQELLHREWLTAYQLNQIFQGKASGLVIGPYILLERIGEGGMGQVFKARQKTLNRIVAVKVIRKECLDNPKVTLRFLREIRLAGQLNHPHIVRAYDADQVNGIYYIAMEYIDGVDLARLVKELGPLPVNRACEYIRQAALGLQHAFERGMVHRDIKPANLLVTRGVASDRRRSSGVIPRPVELNAKRPSGVLQRSESALHYPFGVVKILDMGLARCTESFTGQAATHLTQVGSVMGTPEFIAPEQARDSHTCDVRADIYSLGCTLYFLLTGQAPFAEGTMTEKLMQHQFNEPESVADVRVKCLRAWRGPHGPADTSEAMLHVPAPVDQVVRKLLAKEPEDRFQTPAALANELQRILNLIADGKLKPEDDLESTSLMEILPPVAAPAVEKKPAAQPIISLTAKTPPPSFAGKLGIVLATLGGLACITAVTGLAVVMSVGAPMRANTKGLDEIKPKVKMDEGKAKR